MTTAPGKVECTGFCQRDLAAMRERAEAAERRCQRQTDTLDSQAKMIVDDRYAHTKIYVRNLELVKENDSLAATRNMLIAEVAKLTTELAEAKREPDVLPLVEPLAHRISQWRYNNGPGDRPSWSAAPIDYTEAKAIIEWVIDAALKGSSK